MTAPGKDTAWKMTKKDEITVGFLRFCTLFALIGGFRSTQLYVWDGLSAVIPAKRRHLEGLKSEII